MRRVAVAAAALALAASVSVWLGRFFWLTELTTHFRMQLVVACVLAAVAAAAIRAWPAALVLAAIGGLHLAPMAPYLWSPGRDADPGPPAFRIVSANVSKRNHDYASLQQMLVDAAPDLVGLVEVDERRARSLDALAAEYPYVISRPEPGAFGLLLMSRFPLRELERSPYRHEGAQTAILAEADIDGRPVSVVLTHVRAPMSPEEATDRNLQLAAIARFFREDARPDRLLIGDLNVTPWSPRYGVIEAGTGLANAARGQGYLWTWPVGLAIFRIPIDHCLLSEGFRVERIGTGPDIGSDHLPLIVDLGIVDVGIGGPNGAAKDRKDAS